MLPEIVRLPPSLPGEGLREVASVLAESRGTKIECLVSNGESSEPGFWYDQPRDEWVLLLSGSAVLRFETGDLSLAAGDSLTIPARIRHRVESVSSDAVWLAVFLDA